MRGVCIFLLIFALSSTHTLSTNKKTYIMNKKTYLAIMLAAPLATACVNSDYDLSDINTEVEVPVKDLIVPIELKDFSLNSVIDINENDKIKEVNGEYAVVVDGDFESDKINVDPITTNVPKINDIKGTMQKKRPSEFVASNKRVMSRANDLGAPIAYYKIPSEFKPVIVTTDDLSEAIKKLKGAKIDTNLEVTINLDKAQKLAEYVSSLHIKDLKFQVPKGIDGEFCITNEAGEEFKPYDYDKTTGIVQFLRVDLTLSGIVTLKAHITGLDENALDNALHEIEGKVGKELTIDEKYGVQSGFLAVYESDRKDAASSRRRAAASNDDFFDMLPDNLEYLSTAKMDEVKVTSFSGEIDYDVKDFAMDNVSLTDVPDLLQQSGTNIGLANPQIYVHVVNPIADGKGNVVTASAKIDLAATLDDGTKKEYKMNLDSKVSASKKDNYFVLSPRQPEVMYAGYEEATWVPFDMLADLLRSNGNVTSTLDEVAQGGIPKSIDIKVTDAHVRSTNVVDYELGQTHQIHGNYLFYAPLEMSENSSIRYEETVDGWKESLEDVNVARLNVQAKVSTDVPFELQFRIKPIKEDGTTFDGEYSIATVPAKAKNEAIALTIAGSNLSGIDGIRIEALALSKEEGALRPDMNISITDLKVQVSGSYKGKF